MLTLVKIFKTWCQSAETGRHPCRRLSLAERGLGRPRAMHWVPGRQSSKLRADHLRCVRGPHLQSSRHQLRAVRGRQCRERPQDDGEKTHTSNTLRHFMTVLRRALEQRIKVVGFQCSACIAGSGPVNGRTACAGCNGTTYSQIGVCDDCPAPSVVSDDHVRCYGCPAGLAPNAERNACVACASLDGLTYSPLGTSCDDREGDDVVNNRRTSCLSCTAGFGPNDNRTGCEACSVQPGPSHRLGSVLCARNRPS